MAMHPPAESAAQPQPPKSRMLDRILLWLRMAVYAQAFLGFVLAAMPWAFYQIDVFFPALHVEIGWLRYLGLAYFALCLSAYLIASYVLTSRGKGPFVEFDPPKELVITGPYKLVRNPVVAFSAGIHAGRGRALLFHGDSADVLRCRIPGQWPGQEHRRAPAEATLWSGLRRLLRARAALVPAF